MARPAGNEHGARFATRCEAVIMTTEVVTMKMISIKEFRDHATQHLKTSEPIIIMRGSTPAGVFLPWDESMLPPEIVKKAMYEQLSRQLQEQLERLHISDPFFAHRRMSKHGIDHLPISTKFDVVSANEDLSEDSVVTSCRRPARQEVDYPLSAGGSEAPIKRLSVRIRIHRRIWIPVSVSP